jgi:hypothetical protein
MGGRDPSVRLTVVIPQRIAAIPHISSSCRTKLPGRALLIHHKPPVKIEQ